MHAVNLIPADLRRSSGFLPGRASGGVYVLLVGLALVVALVGFRTHLSWQADDLRARTAVAEQRAAASERTAAPVDQDTSWTALKDKRIATVRTLAASRMDWAHALRELARVLPRDVTIDSLTASASPSAGSGDAGGAGTGLRGALALPALELVGCAADQDHVMSAMATLRQMDGVARVTLASSERATATDASQQSAAPAASGAAGSAGCQSADPSRPKFSAVVFLDAPAAAVAP